MYIYYVYDIYASAYEIEFIALRVEFMGDAVF